MATAVLTNAPADPAVLFAEEIDDLLLEAKNHLDGDPITSEEQAEAVASLLNRLRRVAKDADLARKQEKAPHDMAATAVQHKWLPLLGKAEIATKCAKDALAPWLQAVEEKNQADAAAARKEADRLAIIAHEARLAASGNLEATEDAERLVKAATAAQKDAAKAEKARAIAKGGERGIGLVDTFTPVLTDSCAALKHYREHQPEALKAWLLDQARQDVRGGVRSIPGFTIDHERNAR